MNATEYVQKWYWHCVVDFGQNLLFLYVSLLFTLSVLLFGCWPSVCCCQHGFLLGKYLVKVIDKYIRTTSTADFVLSCFVGFEHLFTSIVFGIRFRCSGFKEFWENKHTRWIMIRFPANIPYCFEIIFKCLSQWWSVFVKILTVNYFHKKLHIRCMAVSLHLIEVSKYKLKLIFSLSLG